MILDGDMYRLGRVAAFFVGLLSVLPGTAAAEIPTFDSIVYCERLRQEVSADHKVSAQCLSVQEYARSELEEFWPGATPEMRTLCSEGAGGQESYAELAVCVLGQMREVVLIP